MTKLKLKYLTYNNGLPYYQRALPKYLQAEHKQQLLRIPLRTALSAAEIQSGFNHHISLALQINQIAAHHTGLFKTRSPLTNPDASEIVMLSEALSIYLANHQRGKDKKFISYTQYKWNTFMRIVGDMPLVQLSRTHAKQYRDKRLNEKVKTVNRLANLRIVSASENNRNTILSRVNKTGYRGVTQIRSANKYQARIRSNGKNKHLGIYETALEAFRAYSLARATTYNTNNNNISEAN